MRDRRGRELRRRAAQAHVPWLGLDTRPKPACMLRRLALDPGGREWRGRPRQRYPACLCLRCVRGRPDRPPPEARQDQSTTRVGNLMALSCAPLLLLSRKKLSQLAPKSYSRVTTPSGRLDAGAHSHMPCHPTRALSVSHLFFPCMQQSSMHCLSASALAAVPADRRRRLSL